MNDAARGGGGLDLVIASDVFAVPAGTESYMLTIARELERLGHRVVIVADELGPMADHAERGGLRVARSASDVPAAPDAVLANDAISAAAAAERHPGARIVQTVHSDLHDHQLPALLDGVVDAVVVPSGRIEQRVRALPLRVPIVRLTQPIDTQRFAPQGPLRERPRRALVLSHYLTGPRLHALTDAWEARGIECVHVGEPAQASLDVVPALAGADIVVGKARAALEGMSCARAVYVYDVYGGDGWVTPEAYEAMEADNFAGFATGRPKTAADVAADLDDYRPEMGWVNRELVVAHHSARRHAAALVELVRELAAPAVRPVEVLAEVSRLTRLGWHAERRTMLAQAETAELRSRALDAERAARDAEAEAAQAGALRARVAAAEADADAWRARAAAAEDDAHAARTMLGTRRAQAGLRIGRTLDRMLGRA